MRSVRYSGDEAAKLGKTQVVCTGRDLTILTHGAQAQLALSVAESPSRRASIEVVELQTISPLDKATSLNPLRDTRR
ncbi:transketolase C-terminal domain-containing protein [Acidithrix sp. C25]|uniref:transketolase C-terminal domain-containing protein n=1 Tax=Acidithrix sp. C25 TaxID=1671482 RepID=UPI0024BDE953|nr:transketolase C-terminal domain-containing protein [Acidithrix sp. C25]